MNISHSGLAVLLVSTVVVVARAEGPSGTASAATAVQASSAEVDADSESRVPAWRRNFGGWVQAGQGMFVPAAAAGAASMSLFSRLDNGLTLGLTGHIASTEQNDPKSTVGAFFSVGPSVGWTPRFASVAPTFQMGLGYGEAYFAKHDALLPNPKGLFGFLEGGILVGERYRTAIRVDLPMVAGAGTEAAPVAVSGMFGITLGRAFRRETAVASAGGSGGI